MIAALKILPGEKFGRLTCVEELPRRNKMRFWSMRCDCGLVLPLMQKSFTSGGRQTSCGCDKKKSNHHGLSRRPEYRNWVNMISRCENQNTPFFENYGGRGISVSARWRENFENFFADMGVRPTQKHSVDRIDVNGNYEPGNCRWALQSDQCRNTRSNHIVNVDGRDITLAEAVEGASVTYNTVLYRLRRGWLVSDALRMPAKKGFRPHA